MPRRFNSFITCLFYMSHDPSPANMFDLWLMNGPGSVTFFFIG